MLEFSLSYIINYKKSDVYVVAIFIFNNIERFRYLDLLWVKSLWEHCDEQADYNSIKKGETSCSLNWKGRKKEKEINGIRWKCKLLLSLLFFSFSFLSLACTYIYTRERSIDIVYLLIRKAKWSVLINNVQMTRWQDYDNLKDT